jgi:putative PIN family toxin of toxin-antitoxin system
VRIVFDTNVLARAHHLSHGPARQALVNIFDGPHILIVSQYLLHELDRVLAYPRLLRRSGLTRADILEYLERLAEAATLVDPAPVPRDVLSDPDDEPILGTALAGRADVLCTRDAHFFEESAQRFCASHGIRLLTDRGLLRESGFSPGGLKTTR